MGKKSEKKFKKKKILETGNVQISSRERAVRLRPPADRVGVAPRRRLSDTESLDSRVARLEAHWDDLMQRLDRQLTELTTADGRMGVLIEKLDQRLTNESSARAELDARFRIFVAKVVIIVVVVVGVGETMLTLFGPAIRQALGLPQT